jgi:hypothetical protein
MHKMKCKLTSVKWRKLPDVGIKKRSKYLNEDHKRYKLPHNGTGRDVLYRVTNKYWELMHEDDWCTHILNVFHPQNLMSKTKETIDSQRWHENWCNSFKVICILLFKKLEYKVDDTSSGSFAWSQTSDNSMQWCSSI